MTCTARWATGNGAHRAGDLCGQPATERVGDSDLCLYHFGRALDWFYKRRIELPEKRQREHEESLRQAAEARRLAAEARSIVYYLHRPADGLIKIGTSTDHKSRFSDLRREHGPLRLLLAHPGSYAEETDAHGRFAALWVEGEWFRPELPLLKAVLRMRTLAPKGDTRLPAQVPVTEIEALIKTARKRRGPLTATLTATGNMDSSGQEPTCMPLPGFSALESAPVRRRPGLRIRRLGNARDPYRCGDQVRSLSHTAIAPTRRECGAGTHPGGTERLDNRQLWRSPDTDRDGNPLRRSDEGLRASHWRVLPGLRAALNRAMGEAISAAHA